MKEQDRKRITHMCLDHNGSTLIVVIVGMAFLTVLATIILAVSSANVQMKNIEYLSKRNFYEDESVLDQVYHGVGKVSANILSQVYADVLARVGTEEDESGYDVYTTQYEAYSAFSKNFIEGLKVQYSKEEHPDATEKEAVLKQLESYVIKESGDTRTFVVGYEGAKVENVTMKTNSASEDIPYQYKLLGVSVTYEALDHSGKKTGFEETITTDIVIEVPYINFFQDSSRIFDYVMVANEGIYFEGSNKSDIRTVEGNIYAGTYAGPDPKLSTYWDASVAGGINFSKITAKINSNFLISKGDINVYRSDLTIGSISDVAPSQVWAESIRTAEGEDRGKATVDPSVSSKIDITGNMYVANDLELNAGHSEVILSGNYYGYNDRVYETMEMKAGIYDTGQNEHTQSSAMILNGNGTTLDLSGLETLLISGVAYVDMASNAYAGTPLPPLAPSLINEYETGESLALKANQYIYLAPSYCLTVPNPVEVTTEIPEEVWSNEYKDDWFGFKGLAYVNSSTPVISKDVVHRTTGRPYRYYYLNFNDGMREKYADFILNMTDPDPAVGYDADLLTQYHYDEYSLREQQQIWEIKKALQSRVSVTKNTIIDLDLLSSGKARIYTKGTLARISTTTTTDDVSTLSKDDIMDDNKLSVDYVREINANLHKHYFNLYTNLDAKAGISLTTEPGEPSIDPRSDRNLLPASAFVDFGKMTGTNKETTERDAPKHHSGDYTTVIAPGDYTVPSTPFTGIIISAGDVTISGDVRGLVIAAGKIYVKGGGSIIADRSVVQSIIDEEMYETSKTGELGIDRFAMTYLWDIEANITDTADYSDRISGTDYTEYMSYENWVKG